MHQQKPLSVQKHALPTLTLILSASCGFHLGESTCSNSFCFKQLRGSQSLWHGCIC